VTSIAIYASDPDARRQLEGMLRSQPAFTLAGSAADDVALRALVDRNAADVVLAVAPSHNELSGWRARFAKTSFVVLISDPVAEGLDALAAGARALLPRSASAAEITAAIAAARSGLSVLPPALVAMLLAGDAIDAAAPVRGGADPALTPRELDVLAALADGASNKAIARRLGISYHTVKFHVAAILAKLDADTRTEAVARAAHLGLVML
jgi:two-component system, NarL family, response regulator YdfI